MYVKINCEKGVNNKGSSADLMHYLSKESTTDFHDKYGNKWMIWMLLT
jgi:hypothetical protein